MSNILYFLTVLLIFAFGAVSYFAGYVYGKASEGRPIEIKSIVPRKKKPPDPKTKEQLEEINRQLYNVEHYTGSADGMKRKGGEG